MKYILYPREKMSHTVDGEVAAQTKDKLDRYFFASAISLKYFDMKTANNL